MRTFREADIVLAGGGRAVPRVNPHIGGFGGVAEPQDGNDGLTDGAG